MMIAANPLTPVVNPIKTSTAQEGLAIVALDCLFPDANGPQQYWQNILNQHCAIRNVPSSNYRYALEFESHLAALMPDLEVKPQKFRLPPKLVRNFDPRVFKMLEVVQRVLASEPVESRERMLTVLCTQVMAPQEQASSSLGRRIKVLDVLEQNKTLQGLDPAIAEQLKVEFSTQYDQVFPNPGFDGFLAESSSLMTSIIPKTFGLGGGHIAIDATCASTIAALQVAWDAILTGRNDSALIVAMAPSFHPSWHIHFMQAGVCTEDAVLPFDATANGFALGEGIGVMLVKRLQDAEARGNKIYSVIRGLGFSSDSRGSGFVSPQQEGQIRAMRAAYQNTEITPDQIRLIEAHATGTPKGDSTELDSMQKIFGKQSTYPEKLYVGSVKGNIGHLLEASGMASIFKLSFALSEGILPPTICHELHPVLKDPDCRFQLLQTPQPWPEEDVRRLAAANSFGFGGVNAHVILEAHPSTAKGLKPTTLSAGLAQLSSIPVSLSESGSAHNYAPSESSPLMDKEIVTTHSTHLSTHGSSSALTVTAQPEYPHLPDAEVEAEVLAIISQCTGYEIEELQLDHDLDADLGVDSIKHMEILFTVGERFRIQAEEGEQITDYPTIRELVTLAQTRQNTSTGEQPSGMMAELMAGLESMGDLPPEAAERLAKFKENQTLADTTATADWVSPVENNGLTPEPAGMEPLTIAAVEATSFTATPEIEPVSAIALGRPVIYPEDDINLPDAEVEAEVLAIISQCTGYEIEELQLDHDLDADLGVDSIKHMEILFTVGERFRIQAEEGEQITDYPTIRELVTLAQTRQNTSTGDQPSGMMAELMAGLESMGDLPPEAAERLAKFKENQNLAETTFDEPASWVAPVTSNGSPTVNAGMEEGAIVASGSANLTVIPEIEPVLAIAMGSSATNASDAINLPDAEVEAEVLAIISQCTGYEIEELQLDHDLDADLGVDSIKHMEILFTVGERFRIQAEEGEQITDYPTIRELVTLAQTRQNTSTGDQPSGMMAELMAGLESMGDLPPEAAERLAKFKENQNLAETTFDEPASWVAPVTSNGSPTVNAGMEEGAIVASGSANLTVIPEIEPVLAIAMGSSATNASDAINLPDAEVEAEVLAIISQCTGYEIEELQLDHDLDADLGVDSIKHMEILFTVGERFRIQAEEGEQITDYPTIRELVTLAQTRQNTSTGEQPSGMMAELMAGLESMGDLPPEAAERLAKFKENQNLADTTAPEIASTIAQAEVSSEQPSDNRADFDNTVELTNSQAQVTEILAAKFNYEPAWLTPHLHIISDLGLSHDELNEVRSNLGLSPNGLHDLTIQDMATQVLEVQRGQASVDARYTQPHPVPLKASKAPRSSAQSAQSGTETWVLIMGQANPQQANLGEQIYALLQNYQGSVLQLNGANASHTFALTVDLNSASLARDIQTKLDQSQGQSLPEQSVWWGKLPSTDRLNMAWVFPGSGSLYPGLLDELKPLNSIVGETVNTAQGLFHQITGQELSFDKSTDPLMQRPATVTTSTAIAALLESFGLQPSLLAGHSVGELTACHKAGAFSFEELMRLTTAPFLGLKAYPKGAMLAVIGSEAVTRRLVQASQGKIIVSNRNSHQQLVVSGQPEDIRWFTERALALGLKPIPLDVPTAYHSPVLVDAHHQYRQVLQRTVFQVPTIPLVSGLTGDLLPWSTVDFAQTRSLLDCAFIAPVNYVAQLERLFSLGTQVLVDIGPTDRLAKLARETLDPTRVTILETNRVKRSSRLIFLEALAQLHTLGYPIRVPEPQRTPIVVNPEPMARTSSGTPASAIASASVSTPARATTATVLKESPTVDQTPTANLTHGTSRTGSLVLEPIAKPMVATPGVQPESVQTSAVVPASFKQPALDLLNNRPSLLEPIAIIGMGCVMPDASNIEEFWQNLLQGHSAIREMPQDDPLRWKISTFYNPDPRAIDKSYSKIGAFIPELKFKPIEFRLTPKTASLMDRSQKMALLATRETFKDSGYHEKAFDRKRVRVVIGTSIPEAHDLGAPRLFFEAIVDEGFQSSEVFRSLPEDIRTQMVAQARDYIYQRIPACSEDSMPGGLPNIVAGRIAFCFDLQGGNVVLDAACAASLGALDHSIKSLQMGDVDMVITGGSDSAMSAGSYVAFCKTYALSAKGSFPFDAKADGFVMGEGCGILLLKRLADAERDSDPIYAVIRGCGSSSDGKAGRGITAPSIDGQVLAMQNAYQNAGIDPATIGFIEAHGTSTALGDTTEFASLVKQFGATTSRKLYLGSVKSMIGHLKTAAGVAGLIKAALAVKEGQVPPTLNFQSPGPNIDLAHSPFTINTQTCAWERQGETPRRAAVNSFGFGGTNFHVIVEEYRPEFYRSEQFRQEVLASRPYQDFYGKYWENGAVVLSDATVVHPEVVLPVSVPSVSAAAIAPTESFANPSALAQAIQNVKQPLAVIGSPTGATVQPVADRAMPHLQPGERLIEWVGAMEPEMLGAPSFRQAHGVRYNYIAGAMAAGIGSTDIVVDMAKAGMLGFFGAGGVPLGLVEKAIVNVRDRLNTHPNAAFGFNLLHNPIEFGVEEQTVDLYLKYGVRKISASAYLRLMPSVVRYRASGMKRLPDGTIYAPNSVFAKISSLDIAAQFMSPPPAAVLKHLVSQGRLTPEEAELASQLPVAQDITAEADSGGHTDRRPLSVLLPQILRLRDEIAARYGYAQKGIHVRVGAAGGIGDPMSARSAFALGADYILTGSINQTTVQAGTSDLTKQMLAQATMTDMVMAPAADMFEMGVEVQVLKRGSFYPQRARKLYNIYKQYSSLDTIPADERTKLERDVFRQPLDELWQSTAQYWQQRDPKQLEKAEKDGKHKMALTFRAYLGLSSRWAQTGQVDRKSDYQIWCGPALGLFNEWVKGTWLEPLENRDVAQIGLALMHGAAVLNRAERLAHHSIAMPAMADLLKPIPLQG